MVTSREQGCWARERPDPPRETDENKRNSTVRYWQGEKETMLDWMPTLENDPCVPPSSACMRQHLLPEGCHSSLITTWLHACCAASVTSNYLWLYGLQPARLLCPWDSPGKNTGVGHHALLQGIFPTQGSNSRLSLLHWQAGSLLPVPPGKPITTWVWLNWQAKPSGNFTELAIPHTN